jgi:hypothetical protein
MPIIDIETKPRPDLVKRFVKPYPDFDPDAVKYGNTKDPAKRAGILQEKQEEHVQAAADHWRKAEERAALNPLTAEILCLGIMEEDGKTMVLHGTEVEILTAFWLNYSDAKRATEPFLFWSGRGSPYENFDHEFILKRSWIIGVKVPPSALGKNRFQDAATRYLFGQREAFCSLSDAADQLGLFEKFTDIFPKNRETDRVTGANFHLWWAGEMPDVTETAEQQRELALKYLFNDLLILLRICGRIF